ncbi:HET-domain-containing protein, partial [Massarina eburnea CBS 473.64]
RYQALNRTSREIRYISIQPSFNGDHNSPLVCSLGHLSLDDANRIQYEALSYCWWGGFPITLQHLNQNSTSQEYWVTRNLDAALRSLRRINQERVLWVDAININQNNPIERGQQVSFMGEIYSEADQVLVLLGEEDASTPIVRRVLETYESGYPRIENMKEQLPRRVFDRVMRAMDSLLRRPWFSRVWVIQEV